MLLGASCCFCQVRRGQERGKGSAWTPQKRQGQYSGFPLPFLSMGSVIVFFSSLLRVRYALLGAPCVSKSFHVSREAECDFIGGQEGERRRGVLGSQVSAEGRGAFRARWLRCVPTRRLGKCGYGTCVGGPLRACRGGGRAPSPRREAQQVSSLSALGRTQPTDTFPVGFGRGHGPVT